MLLGPAALRRFPPGSRAVREVAEGLQNSHVVQKLPRRLQIAHFVFCFFCFVVSLSPTAVDGMSEQSPGGRPATGERGSSNRPEVHDLLFLRVGPGFRRFLGSKRPLPSFLLQSLSAQVGGFAPHLRRWVLKREAAASTPKNRRSPGPAPKNKG